MSIDLMTCKKTFSNVSTSRGIAVSKGKERVHHSEATCHTPLEPASNLPHPSSQL